MKFLILFLSFVAQAQAQAQDLTGTWAFSGAGCRDANSLSADSHISIPHSKLSTRPAIFTFTSSNVTVVMADKNGRAGSVTFNYSIRNDKLIFQGPDHLPDVYIQDDNTLVSVNKGYSSITTQLCCDYQYVRNWRDIKRRDPKGWERDLEENGWDESYLIANDKEWEKLRLNVGNKITKLLLVLLKSRLKQAYFLKFSLFFCFTQFKHSIKICTIKYIIPEFSNSISIIG